MGTRVTLTVEHPRPEAQLARGAALIRDYENRLSANLPSSEIARINQMAGVQPVAVDPVVYRLVREAVLVSRSRAGFNAAIGPLVQLWRIGFEDAQIPERTAIDSCRELSDPDRIELDDAHSSVFLGRPGMKLDLGAIAKGWIADAIKQTGSNLVPTTVVNMGGAGNGSNGPVDASLVNAILSLLTTEKLGISHDADDAAAATPKDVPAEKPAGAEADTTR